MIFLMFHAFMLSIGEYQNTLGKPQTNYTSSPSITPNTINETSEIDASSIINPQSKLPAAQGPQFPNFSVFVPTEKTPTRSPGIVEKASVIDRSIWRAIAHNAWRYFQPGTVDPDTMLPRGSSGFPYFTDWDLGVYIQAIIDAQKIHLLKRDGSWGANHRLETIVTFLETRQLKDSTLPYWFYQAENGEPKRECLELGSTTNVADSGKLLVALDNLKTYNSNLSIRIDNIVYNRVNYAGLLYEIDNLATSINIYDYFVTSGFAAFWPEKSSVPTTIIDNILSTPKLDLNGAELPIASITCEPLFHSIFDLKHPDSRIFNLSRQVYLAHEGWYNSTGIFRAFSEGLTVDRFAYEWVVLPDGRTWSVLDEHGSNFGIIPIIYSKVAYSFLSLYNSTYARNMVVNLEATLPDPWTGYYAGMHEDGESVVNGVGCNTNGLIVSAARYAIEKP